MKTKALENLPTISALSIVSETVLARLRPYQPPSRQKINYQATESGYTGVGADFGYYS
jgi:hypothetical protein